MSWALTAGKSPGLLFPPLDDKKLIFPCGVCLSLQTCRPKYCQAYLYNGLPAGVGSALLPTG